MSNHPETELLVKDYARALGSGDLGLVLPFYADNIVYEDTALNQICYGLDDVKKSFAEGVRALDVRLIVDSCYATEEGFAIAWHMGGVHEADVPRMPATGRFFTVPGASVARVKNGQIVRNRDFWNNLDLLKQLGLK